MSAAVGQHAASSRRSVVLVLAGGGLLGTAGTAAAYAPGEATPLGLGGLRLLVGALALLIVVPWLGGSRRSVLRLGRRRTVWVMAIGTAGFQPLFFGAVDRAGVAISSLIAIGGVPVFAGLLSWAVRSERPSRQWLVATTIAIAGLALRSSGELSGGDSVGVVMAFAAAACVACYVVAAKAELDRGTAVIEIPAAVYTIGAVLLAPLVLTQPLAWTLEPSGIATVLYLGIVTMGIGNVCSIEGMRAIAPAAAATLMLSDPLTSTFLGVVLLGEEMPASALAGTLLVLVGLVLQARSTTAGRAATVDAGVDSGTLVEVT